MADFAEPMSESTTILEAASFPELGAVKAILTASYLECSDRGLLQSAEWCIELADSLANKLPGVPQGEQGNHDDRHMQEYVTYCRAKALYDLREFKRAAYILRDCKSDKSFFLRSYCTYLNGEKTKEDNVVDVIGEAAQVVNEELPQLRRVLSERESSGHLDGYGYYLYGIVLKELQQTKNAQTMFLRSCHLNPMLWASWMELTRTCEDREMLYNLTVPNHWMKLFFLALGCLELHLSEEALGYYLRLAHSGFESSSYVMSQLALAAYNLKDFSKALEQFHRLHVVDPYRLAGVDVFSHILFVRKMLPELTTLAQGCVEVDRYRFETLCAIANLYSLRGEHEKAVTYFEMAVKVNLSDQSACVLLGHEYLELRNLPMAIDAYSRGVEANSKDFRGYYGLGQAYELMKVPTLALHFYSKAYKLKPNDSRMLVALGDCYSALGKIQEAKKCYKHAIGIGDYEQTAILKLAKLHEQLGQIEEAAMHYERYVAQAETQGGTNLENVSKACIVLARYCLQQSRLLEAESYATRAAQTADTLAEGKSLLNEVATRRTRERDAQLAMDEPPRDANVQLLDFEISPIV